jgi:tripartite-type tricarboxylate transporter receptor subunit TctC
VTHRFFAAAAFAVAAATTTAGLALVAADAQAQAPAAWPSRPITMVVPFAPGGIADITGRPLAQAMSRTLGQPIVIENRPGAGGGVGMVHVARQKPDGYTLLMALSSIVTIPEADRVNGRVPSYQMKEFTPVALVSADPTVLIVRADSPWKTVADLMKDARSRPGKITYSSSGIYGTLHVAVEMLGQSAGAQFLHVPFGGGGPAMTALLGGQVEVTAQAPGVASPHVKAGKVRLLGSWGAQRLKAFPELPTMREAGFEAEFYIWSGVFAPAGLPADVLSRVRGAVREAVGDPVFMKAMATMETPILHLQGAEFDEFLQRDSKRLADVIRRMGKLE